MSNRAAQLARDRAKQKEQSDQIIQEFQAHMAHTEMFMCLKDLLSAQRLRTAVFAPPETYGMLMSLWEYLDEIGYTLYVAPHTKKEGYAVILGMYPPPAKVQVITHASANPSDRKNKMCRCSVCGREAIATIASDYYATAEGDPLKCEPCMLESNRPEQVGPPPAPGPG